MNGIFKEAILDVLADDIKRITAKTCATIAEIHMIDRPENQFQEGYNVACRTIAAKIKELT